MKKNSLSYIMLFVATFMLLFTGSCQKSPINGDLDGQWQVMDVTPEPSETVFPERLYICFSLHVCQLTGYDVGVHAEANMQFDQKKKTLYLDFPNINTEESIARLAQYGIYNNPVTFDVELLTSSKLILRDGDVVVTLRKF